MDATAPLVLRPVSVEYLPSEDDDDEVREQAEPKPAPKPKPRRGLFGVYLENTLAGLRRIAHRRQQLIALDRAEIHVACKLLSAYQASVRSLNNAVSCSE